MKILVSGASGLIGEAITQSLMAHGHQVFALQRNTPQTTPYWQIAKKTIELGEYTAIDVVINLAGENIAVGRWTPQKKARILASRVEGTRLIADFFSKAEHKPKVVISASAVGIYGDRGSEELDEDSIKGSGFLSEVCSQWEAATGALAKAGIRVANVRFGMVLSSKGGALAKMQLPFSLGLGGIIGDGQQYMSWITINDLAEAINHIINCEALSGPINVVAPQPVTNYRFTKTLGKALRRPTVLPLPAFLAKLIFGEMAKDLLLASTRVKPGKLLKSGYIFHEPNLEDALRQILSD